MIIRHDDYDVMMMSSQMRLVLFIILFLLRKRVAGVIAESWVDLEEG